jgi:hypothetical protein
MTARSWIIAGWVCITAAVGLAIAAIIEALDAVDHQCVQPLVRHGLVAFACPGAAAEFVRGLICGVLAGVAFFSGLACFLWAAHLRSVQQFTRIHQSQVGVRPRLFG